MAILRNDDPQFLAHVETAIFMFEEFKSVNGMMVAELMHEMKNEMTAVALALYHCSDEELVQKFVKNMASAQAFAYRDTASELAQVTVGQQTGARFRIIEKARELQQQGRILLKKYSPLYQDD